MLYYLLIIIILPFVFVTQNMAATNVISNQPHKSFDLSSCSDESTKLNEDLAKLRTLITQSQTQSVESDKFSSYGSSTITQCLHEEREENQRLRAKIKKLESSPGGTTKQSSLITTREYGPMGKLKSSGYSKQMVDNLIRENMKLRSSLKSFSRNPEALDRLTQEKEELELKLTEANGRINSLVGELDFLRSQIGGSPNEKEVKIVDLTRKVEKLERERENSEERCQSLMEESSVLRRQLTELVEMCQEFAKKLSEKEQQLSKQQQMTVDNALEKMSVNGPGYKEMEGQLHHQRRRSQELQSHIQLLVRQRDELAATNSRMQTQSSEQERKIAEMRDEIQALQNTQASESSASSDLAEVIATVDKLHVEKSQLQNENQHLREEIAQMRDELSLLRNQPRGRQVDEEHVQMLEQQIQICTEDFQHERSDREKAQAKVAELETEVDLLRRQLDQFQMSHMARLRAQRDNALNYYRNQHYATYGGGRGAPSGMRARGMIVADGDNEEDSNQLEVDEIDSPQSSISMAAQPSVSVRSEPNMEPSSSSSIKDDSLQCPRCKKEYAAEEHNRFLEHIDECCS